MSLPEDDDALLALLRASAKARDEENRTLEGVARGEAPGDAVDPALSALVAPFDRDLQDRIATRALATLPRKKPVVVLLRPVAWIAPVLAAAAIAVLWLRPPTEGALPTYALEIAPSTAELRGGSAPAHHVVRGGAGPVILVARPSTRPRGPVDVHVFGPNDATELPAAVLVAEEGSARIEIQQPALVGVDELRVVVVPRGGDARKRLGDRLSVRVVDAPPDP